ncbi:hypothetical protein [Streptomyces sp. NPDC050988]|uniref:hypothetical protein n=1 Tax=Streptomyces sp. NPDC050988 TaxID=3365637 RepID=UPI00379D35DC
MTIRSYFGFPEPSTRRHATDGQQAECRTGRLVTTAATGTAVTVAACTAMALTFAGPATAEPFSPKGEIVATDFVPYEGNWVTIKPVPGSGGLFLRDTSDNVRGLMGEGDRAIVLGAHPTNPHRVMVVQTTSGHGGWGVVRGYVNADFARNINGGPIPVGG